MNRYIERKHAIHTFSPDHVSVTSARPGETPIFEIYDCHMGQLPREGSNFSHMDRNLANPATGSIYTRGACPQDILRLAIRSIELDQAGILGRGPTTETLKEYFPEYIIRRLPVKDGTVHYGHLQISAHPMIGVIGTALKGHAVSILAPGGRGGNMDCTSIGPGAVLYPPVRMPGALLAMGDLHAVMGDGEYGNCGVETGGRVAIQVDVVKNHPIPWLLVETGNRWVATASRENVDEACQKIMNQMFMFPTAEAGFSKLDVGVLIDMLGNPVVYQIVNPQEIVHLEIPEWPLEKLRFYGFVDQESITHGLKGEQEVRP